MERYFIRPGIEPSTCSDVIQHVIPKFVDHLKEEEPLVSKQYWRAKGCELLVEGSVCLDANILMQWIKQIDQS